MAWSGTEPTPLGWTTVAVALLYIYKYMCVSSSSRTQGDRAIENGRWHRAGPQAQDHRKHADHQSTEVRLRRGRRPEGGEQAVQDGE